MRVSGQRFFSAGIAGANLPGRRFWQVAILTGACTIAFAPQADAALFYWQDNDPGYYRPMLAPQPRKPKARKPAAKNEAARKDTSAKPHGPLIIAVSIEQQKMRVYDSNGLFAESPISTGMKGHSTPMGVFSIIQKNKMHRSNIYSGAPMPYMQRITWSGIALHAGVLPGYPASHGCIRMPTAFAVKMWNWTRMGARVIITPGADHACQLLASVAGGTEGGAAAADRRRSEDGCAGDQGRQGRGRRRRGQDHECTSEPRSPIDHRARARTSAHRRCDQRDAGVWRPGDHVRCEAVRRRRHRASSRHPSRSRREADKGETAKADDSRRGEDRNSRSGSCKSRGAEGRGNQGSRDQGSRDQGIRVIPAESPTPSPPRRPLRPT